MLSSVRRHQPRTTYYKCIYTYNISHIHIIHTQIYIYICITKKPEQKQIIFGFLKLYLLFNANDNSETLSMTGQSNGWIRSQFAKTINFKNREEMEESARTEFENPKLGQFKIKFETETLKE